MSVHVDLTPSSETIQKVREALGLNDSSVKESVEGLKKWLELQPHLPKEDDVRLEHWLIRCKNNMETTKLTLDLHYSLKSQMPEIFCNWDLNDPWFQILNNQGFIAVVPKLTEDLDRISIVGLYEDREDLNIYDLIKCVVMSLEARICEDYFLKDIFIVDYKNFTSSFLTKFTLPMMKKLFDCALKGYKCRVRALHIVNSTPLTEILINIAKSFIKSKLISRLHVYGSDFTELYKHVPKSLLPKDYGGECGTIKELDTAWKNKAKTYRDWLLEQEKKKSDESKRPSGHSNRGDMFGFDGSFRQLIID